MWFEKEVFGWEFPRYPNENADTGHFPYFFKAVEPNHDTMEEPKGVGKKAE